MRIRIQKYLSEKGIASRTETESYLAKGWIQINGQVVKTEPCFFDPEVDQLTLNPQIQSERRYYYVFHKPVGIVTVNAQEGETEILDMVDVPKGVVTVGRLDKQSSGLILLSNDGVLAKRLMMPEFEKEKEYWVKVSRSVPDYVLQKMSTGVEILGRPTKPAQIHRISSTRFKIVLTEGRNRQIRRMVESFGLRVVALHRVRIGSWELGSLKPGQLRKIPSQQVRAFLEQK